MYLCVVFVQLLDVIDALDVDGFCIFVVLGQEVRQPLAELAVQT